jgi:hypothetical protein
MLNIGGICLTIFPWIQKKPDNRYVTKQYYRPITSSLIIRFIFLPCLLAQQFIAGIDHPEVKTAIW